MSNHASKLICVIGLSIYFIGVSFLYAQELKPIALPQPQMEMGKPLCSHCCSGILHEVLIQNSCRFRKYPTFFGLHMELTDLKLVIEPPPQQ